MLAVSLVRLSPARPAALALALLLPLGGVSGVAAQEPLPPADPMQQQQPMPGQAPAPAAAPGGDRIGRLEAQIGELQAMVAALQTLVKSSPEVRLPQESPADAVAPAGAPADPGLTARIDALETQMSAISGQLQSMTQQLGALESKLNGGVMNPDAPQPLAPGQEPLQPLPGEDPERQGMAPQDHAGERYASAKQGERFDSAIFSGGEEAPPPPGMPEEAPLPLTGLNQGDRTAALPTGNDPVSLYNQGYGDLLRRDYAAAEISFRQVLARYPKDALAGKSQYWLGETYYMRGQFKDAADSFLKSYKQYPTGEKAPDSLVKLGMALSELGQKDAACSTFNEFGTKYPGADSQLRGAVINERGKLGC